MHYFGFPFLKFRTSNSTVVEDITEQLLGVLKYELSLPKGGPSIRSSLLPYHMYVIDVNNHVVAVTAFLPLFLGGKAQRFLRDRKEREKHVHK